jgi:hypothetical protein
VATIDVKAVITLESPVNEDASLVVTVNEPVMTVATAPIVKVDVAVVDAGAKQ